MTAVGLLVTLLAGVFVVAAYAAVGHLGRIADAIEAQNEHYGIGVHVAQIKAAPGTEDSLCPCGCGQYDSDRESQLLDPEHSELRRRQRKAS